MTQGFMRIGKLRGAAAVAAIALGCVASACNRPDERDDPARLMATDTVATLVGAGDVADCDLDGAEKTARLLDTIRGTVFVAGDVGYATKRHPNPLATCYAATWGRHRARTRPTPGNHEYDRGGPGRYFDYFGDLAGPRGLGYYSYDLGTWHVLALNTSIPSGPRSPQHEWLRADLDANLGRCTIAYMHYPRFSSGPHLEQELVMPVWRTLVAYGVSVAVAGHDHIYERFAPLDADGTPDSVRGIRQFVVGTGGASRYDVKATMPGSEVLATRTLGVLKLSLLPTRYRWEFIPVRKNGFRDRGDAACRPTHAPD